jgi:hypothetical protein
MRGWNGGWGAICSGLKMTSPALPSFRGGIVPLGWISVNNKQEWLSYQQQRSYTWQADLDSARARAEVAARLRSWPALLTSSPGRPLGPGVVPAPFAFTRSA